MSKESKAVEAAKEQSTAIIVQDDSEFANLLDSGRFAQLQRVGRLYAATDLVPEHFKGKPENCFIAANMSIRFGVDLLTLMQSMYIVHGKPGLESKLIIAMVNTRGPFKGPIQWREKGTMGKTGYACTAYAVHKETDEECSMDVTHEVVIAEGWMNKSGSKWKTIPAMMYRYRSAAWLAKLYCPEVIMGLSSVEELHDSPPPIHVDVMPVDGAESPIDAAKRILEKAKAEAPIDAEIAEPTPKPKPPKKDKPKLEIVDNTTGGYEEMATRYKTIIADAKVAVVPDEMLSEFRKDIGIDEDNPDTLTAVNLTMLEKKIAKFIG